MRILFLLLLLLILILFFFTSAFSAEQWKWHDGVIEQRIGPQFIFVFPSTKGRISATGAPIGKIEIGTTIIVAYALKISQGAKARFIAVDTAKLPAGAQRAVNPQLKPGTQEEAIFGFLVKDASQKMLEIHLDPRFAQKLNQLNKEGFRTISEKIAAQGNLSVSIGPDPRVKLKIIRVDVY